MAIADLRLNSQRTHNAKISESVGSIWILLLRLLYISLIISGICLLLIKNSWGWFVVSFFVYPVMFLSWYKGKLKRLLPNEKFHTIDDVLEKEILAKLKPRMTPKDLSVIVGRSTSGKFMAGRFGTTAGFLQNISTEDPKQVDDIWQTAIQIMQKTKAKELTGAMLVMAIIDQCQMKNTFLASMKLEYDDLYEGVKWYNSLQNMIDQSSKPIRTGGIARDWSFGYVPLLQRFGINLSLRYTAGFELKKHEAILDKLTSVLGSGGKKNVSLVGPTGVGKTEIIHAFANRLLDAEADVPKQLQFRQVYLLDSAALISAAPGKGELEGLVLRLLSEAYRAKNIIICLDDAQLFFQEGVGCVDLTNVLLPILNAGNVSMILTMDEQNLLQIGNKNPGLLNALNRINIEPANKEETLQIMQDHLVTTEYKTKVTYMYQSLIEAYKLSERYVHDLEMPGRALKLLDSAAQYAEGKLVTINSVQQAIEKTVGVKIAVASNREEREILLNLEEKIHERMIGQTKAIHVVSDALRRARAGVRNETRPIGTFLFLGPTGVGKTELSKSLADVYFGGENNMIRLDLNEYVSSGDVNRLIADGANDPNSLTAQIMKNPFSVVLLDEIEKAHPSVLTTLLQLLDEGILRDIKNREVSFRDAIVIATSNAGADKIRKYIDDGYSIEQFDQKIIDNLIEKGEFKPEFINRFDEVVIFGPLSKKDLFSVIDLMIDGVNKTLAAQKVKVEVSDEAKGVLVERGYDPKLGARPMRRVVQRAVENTVAKKMLSGNIMPGDVIMVNKDQVEQELGGGGI